MILVGRLTKDAVVYQLKDERKVVNFNIAMNDYYKPKQSDKAVTITTYVTCAYWVNPTIARCLKKGNLVEISGRLTVNVYKNMQGEAKGSLNCHVNAIKIHHHSKQVPATKEEEKIDDLPF